MATISMANKVRAFWPYPLIALPGQKCLKSVKMCQIYEDHIKTICMAKQGYSGHAGCGVHDAGNLT